MKMIPVLVLLSAILPAAAQANDFPTTDRVEYVFECINDHGGKQEYLYKCSCAIDRIADKMTYDQYVEASTASRYRTLGGERGAVFRDPDDVKQVAKKFKAAQDDANKTCNVR